MKIRDVIAQLEVLDQNEEVYINVDIHNKEDKLINYLTVPVERIEIEADEVPYLHAKIIKGL